MKTSTQGDRIAQPRGILLGLERGLTAPYRLYRRARGWRRRGLLALYGLVALAACAFVYREAAIAGLPAIADPFDVAAFEATTVPADRNAFVLYRDAIARIRTAEAVDAAPTLWYQPAPSWAKADARSRSWLEANREALELWRRGTERPEALDRPLGSIRIGVRSDDNTYLFFQSMARLEAMRLEGAGDMAGAWRWYIAGLRCARHLTRYATFDRRTLGVILYDQTAERVVAWSNDPRTKAPELRRALGDLLRMESSPPAPASETFRVNYLAMMHALDDPDRFMREAERGGVAFSHPYSEFRPWYRALWFLRNEPRRARRLVRLGFANWLAQCDKPIEARTPRAPNQPNYPIWFEWH